MRRRSTFVAVAACTIVIGGLAAAPAAGTFRGRVGRIAWAVFSAGGGGGGGFASLTTLTARGRSARVLGQCGEDSSGNVCGRWHDVAYAPAGRRLLWDEPDSAGRRVIVLAGADGTAPHTVAAAAGFDDIAGSFAPGGHRIVYVRQPTGAGGSLGTIVIADLTGAHVTATTLRGAYPEFTPDGGRIVFIAPGGAMWSATPTGRHKRRLISAASAFDITPDGRQIAYVAGSGALFVARIDGSHRHRIAGEPDGSDPIEAVRFSPDGKLLAFAAQGPGSAGDTLYRVAVTGGRVAKVSSTGDARAVTTGLSWQPLR